MPRFGYLLAPEAENQEGRADESQRCRPQQVRREEKAALLHCDHGIPLGIASGFRMWRLALDTLRWQLANNRYACTLSKNRYAMLRKQLCMGN